MMKKSPSGAWQTDQAFDIRISIDGAATAGPERGDPQ
jgi:hypothetical protein